jgi:hypothetical protein
MTDWSRQEGTIRPVEGVMDGAEPCNTDTTTHYDASTQALVSMFEGPPGARSLEVRWILHGPPPSQLIASFLSSNMEIEARIDRYLIEPLGWGIGLKRRGETQLDLKTYGGDAGELCVPRLGQGRIESWQKWSTPLSAAAQSAVDSAKGWLTVRKLRRRRAFTIVRDGVTERACAGPPTAGCSAELSEVHFDNEVWWTFSLEAAGSGSRQLHDLRQTARHLRRAHGELVELNRVDSMSYVQWLRSLRP